MRTRSRTSTRQHSPLPWRIARRVWNGLACIGLTSVIACVVKIDTVQRWLVDPRLDVEVLSWNARRETSSFSGSEPCFDEVKVKLNITPRVRYYLGSFPINQVKSVILRRKESVFVGPSDRPIPFPIKDEPVSFEMTIFAFPMNGPDTWNGVVVEVIDRWGHLSTTSL